MHETPPPSSNEQRFQEVLAGYLQACEAGQAPDRGELLARYPDLADQLSSFFANQQRFHRAAEPIPANTAGPAGAPTVGYEPARGGGALSSFADYEVLGEIARGGMGVVYKARQLSLNRLVAIKMVLAGQFASPGEIERFRAEAKAAGNLDHPNIVPIYEVGEHEGQQYFSMKLVEGGSLAQALAGGHWGGTAAGQRRAAELLARVARGIHHAHQHRILHRDLKPANILLSGVPLVTDFGLAKRVEGDGKLTQSGSIVGTPAYMAPEQASGKDVSTAADVYSLGAILYEMLTGQPPFQGATPLDTLFAVLTQDAPRPRALEPRLSRDLETVCLKCLDKEPSKRYGSAEALAEDLERWLNGEPIVARRSGSLERTIKWARRRPAVAGLMGAVLGVAALGVAGVLWQWQSAVASEGAAHDAAGQAQVAEKKASDRAEREGQANHAAQLARKQEEEARKKEEKARLAERKARQEEARERGKAEAARKKAEDERDAKERALRRAEGLRLTAEASAARHSDPGLALLLALEGTKRAPHRLTFGVLNEALLDCREVKTLSAYLHGVRYSADGRRLLGPASVVDAASGKQLVAHEGPVRPWTAEWAPDGRRAVFTIQDYQTIYYLDGKLPSEHVFTGRVAYVWDMTTGKDVLHLRKHRDRVVSARFSHDGKQIVTASWDQTACLWDAVTGAKGHVLKGHKCSLHTALFSPDSARVLTVGSGRSEGGHGSLWSIEEERGLKKGGPVRDPGIVQRKGQRGGGGFMHYAQDTTDSPIARLWDARTGKQVAALTCPSVGGVTITLSLAGRSVPVPASLLGGAFPWLSYLSWFPRGHYGHPTAADFSPDGERLVIGFREGVAYLWRAREGGGPRAFLRGHKGAISLARFSPDGRHLLTAGDDHYAILWDAESGKELRRLWGHQGGISVVRFSADGRRVLTGSQDRTARLYDVSSGQEKAVFRGHTSGVFGADFSPDGAHVVTSSSDGTTRIWQLAAPKELGLVLSGHQGQLNTLQFSHNGERLLTAGEDETPRQWAVDTGREVLRLGQGKHLGKVYSANFSADGQRIVTASANTLVSVDGKVVNASAVHVWGAEKGDDLLALKEHLNGALNAQFSPDGKLLVTVSNGNIAVHHKGRFIKSKQEATGNRYPGLLRVWDARTGRLLVSLKQTLRVGDSFHRAPFVPLFSPDSRHLLVYSRHQLGYVDHSHLQLVEANTGKAIADLRQERDSWSMVVPAAAFSPDGRRLFTTIGGRSACIWDARTGGMLALLQGFEEGVTGGAFSPDSQRLVTLSGNNAHIWEVKSRRLLATLRGHEAQVLAVAFSPDGRRLVTGANNGEALLWDVESGKTLALFAGHKGPVHLVAVSADGVRIATGSADGTARIWLSDLLSAARQRLPRELTATERVRYALGGGSKESAKAPWGFPEPGMEGGLSNGPKRLAAAEEAKANRWLEKLRKTITKGGAARSKAREGLLERRRTYPGTAPALGAGEMLSRLSSPLDGLLAENVPAEARFAGQPKELVAVLGERRLRHTEQVRLALVSKDGRRVVTSGDNTHLWDAATGDARGTLPGWLLGTLAQTGAVVTMSSGKLHYWDISGPKPREQAVVPFPGGADSIAPDGKVVQILSSGAIRLWKVEAGQAHEWAVLPGHKAYDNRVVFSADGKRAATCGYDKFLRVWALDGDKPRQLFSITGSASRHGALALSPDGKVLAASGNDGNVRLWGLSGLKPVEWPGLAKLGHRAAALAFSPDGKTLAVPGGAEPSFLRLYAVGPAGLRQVAELRGHSGWLYALAFSLDSKMLVSGGADRALRIWDLRGAPKERVVLRGHTGPVTGLAFAPDRPVLASNGHDGTTRLWDLTGTGRESAVLAGGWGEVAFSPNGKALAAGSSFSPLRLWDVSGARPRLRATLPAHSHGPFSFGFSGDGNYLVSGSLTPILRGWDVRAEKPRPWISLPNDQKSASVRSLAVSPDGTLLVGGRNAGRTLLAWRVTEGGLRSVPFPKTEARLVALSPDGKTLATAAMGTVILLWDVSAPVPTIKARVSAHGAGAFYGRVQGLTFSADGRQLASVGGDGRVMVTEVGTGAVQREWKLPGGGQAVAFASDGRHLAVGNSGGTIYVLRVAGPAK